MKKNALAVIVLLFASSYFTALALNPDPVSEDSVFSPGDSPFSGRTGWHMESVGDLESDPPYYFIYWVYKWLMPIKDTEPEIREFFKGQDLRFGREITARAGHVEKLRIAAVGDMMVKRRLDLETGRHLFDDVSDELSGADITFGNLEAPVDPSRKAGVFPAYNSTPDHIRLYKEAGFDVFSTANNHVLDQKESGLTATLDFLDEQRIFHVGSSRSPEERDEGFPIMDAGAVRIAFLAYTFSTNGRKTSPGNEYMVNHIPLNMIDGSPDISLVREHIITARARGADLVVVSLHWNMEFEFYPPKRIIDLGHRIADSGADIILGHHPHVLQPLERFVPEPGPAGPAVPEVLIAYSLGNFIPDAYTLETKTSVILDVEISHAFMDGKEKFWISGVGWTPVWFYKGRDLKGGREYRIINIEKALACEHDESGCGFLSSDDHRRIREADEIIKEFFKPRTGN